MIHLTNYPLFAPPGALASKSHREWTVREAKQYFEWLLAHIDERATWLLSLIGIRDSEEREPRQLLLDASQRVCTLLADPECSQQHAGSAPVLTNVGYSLAADLGLLTAKQIQRASNFSFKWEIVRKPTRDVSYNLPVLRIGLDTYDPVGVSISDALAVLAGRRTTDAWTKVFDSCVTDAEGRAN